MSAVEKVEAELRATRVAAVGREELNAPAEQLERFDRRKRCGFGCGRRVRLSNTTGVCFECQQRGRGRGRQPTPENQTLARFRTAAVVLGLDPEAVLAEWASRWLGKMQDSAASAAKEVAP